MDRPLSGMVTEPCAVHLCTVIGPDGRSVPIWRWARILTILLVCLGLALACQQGQAAEQDQAEQHSVDALRLSRLMEHGQRAEESGRLRDALDRYQEALMMAPADQAVRSAVDRVRGMLGMRPVDDVEVLAREQVQQQLAEIEVLVLLRRAERAAAAGELTAARADCEQAARLLRRFPDDTSSERLQSVLKTIERLDAAALEQRRSSDRQRRQAVQEERIAAMHAEEMRAMNVFTARLARIMDLEQRDHLELALARSRRLLRDYPDDERAEALFFRIMERVHVQRRLTTEQRMAEMREEISNRISQALIPDAISGDPVFPDDWVSRRQHRSIQREEIQVEPWREQILNSLMARLSVAFDGIDFVDAIEHIANQTTVNIIIGTDVRGAPPVDVSLQARGMRIDRILNWLCSHAGTTWSLRNEAVFIGATVSEEPMLRIYDVAGLLHRPPDLPGISVNQAMSGGAGDGPMGGIGGGLFGGGRAAVDAEAMAIEDLVDMIQEAVAPGIWDDPTYGIAIRNNLLLATVPPHVHSLLDEFLHGMRRVHNQLVAIDVTWLEIRDDLVEEIGWNWINRDSVLSGAPLTHGYQNRYTTFSTTAQTEHQLPETAASAGSNLLHQGLSMQYVHLGPPDISAVFTAIHKKRQARILNGINLTTINGVRGNARFARQVGYVSSYSVAGDGNLEPEIGILTVGQSLDIQPYISADRKYVTLNIQPFLIDADFHVERITTVRTVNDMLFEADYILQLPNMRVFEAGTSVIVPDGGSLLVGGFGAFTDQHTSSKVPFLGHLPILGRLFGRRGRYQERWRLYLKLSTKIILYDEVEAMQ